MTNYSETDFELLKILWKHKELSGREIHEIIHDRYSWSYSTTRTVIERSVKKGIVSKKSFHGINVYSARVSKVNVFAAQISRFAEKILEGDAATVLPLFSQTEALSSDEIAELEEILKKGSKK